MPHTMTPVVVMIAPHTANVLSRCKDCGYVMRHAPVDMRLSVNRITERLAYYVYEAETHTITRSRNV